MTPELASPNRFRSADARPAVAYRAGEELLHREVREFMTPGCVTISESASVADAAAALAAHRVHAVLVLASSDGTPRGWVTARGLLPWLGRDRAMGRAADAISEAPVFIDGSALVRQALELLWSGVNTRLIVRRAPHALPEGTITDFDLAVAAGR